ncbi:MAG TPA: TldD/PmbA family protein [Thermoplasmata archaeon]|nr:TldD/PmbA family protein [Thermoplasmata archaeon]
MTDALAPAIAALRKARVKFGDARHEDRATTVVRVVNGEVQTYSTVRRQGVGVRAYVRGAWGLAATTDLAAGTLREAAAKAVKAAKAEAARTKAAKPLRTPRPVSKTLTAKVRTRPEDVDPERKVASLIEFAAEMQKAHTRVASATATYRDSVSRFSVANTGGTDLSWEEIRTVCAGQAVAAENGRREFSFDALAGTMGYELIEKEDLGALGRRIGREAVDLLGAKAAPGGEQTVVCDPAVSGLLAHEVMGHSSEGDEIVKKRSFLTGLVGTRVGNARVTMYDDGTYAGAHGSIPFDSEGTPGHKTKIIERGVYRGYMHSLETAGALRAGPTGNGRAQDYARRVWVRMTNTYFAPGREKFDEIIGDTKSGILTERSLSGMEDPVGGGFQAVTLMGHRIEKGETTDLLRSFTLTGKALEVLKSVDRVSREFSLEGGTCGKGEEDWVPVGDGGPYMRARIIVGGG